MEELGRRYAQLLSICKRLSFTREECIQAASAARIPHPREHTEDFMILYRDALIKRFELAYDVSWKYLKLVLKKRHGIEVASPRTVFQECHNQGILNREEADIFMNMIHDRNELVHTYDESVAERISRHIIDAYPEFIRAIEKIKP